MGYGARDEDEHDVKIVITEEEVLRIAESRGLRLRAAGVAWEISKGKARAFFPMSFVTGGYTEGQLAMIEAAFDGCGVDLFPLEKRFH